MRCWRSSRQAGGAACGGVQACAEGRVGVGNDLNPFATLLTAAKVEPATRAQAATRLAQLRLAWNAQSTGWLALGSRVTADPAAPDALVPAAGTTAGPDGGTEVVPAEVALAFHPRTLGQLLFVRSSLQLDDVTDRFLAAAVTGILHGKSASYLSELMPNTFSMAPRYVRDFAARTAFASPERDVFDGLSKKLDRLFRQPPPPTTGIALLGDARDVAPRARAALRAAGRPDRARLVVTSPPYLRVVKYGYYNWLRTWFLGFDSHAIDAALDDAHHREPYLAFLRDVLAGLRAGPDRRRGDRARHRRRADRPRPADPRRGRAGRTRLGGRGRARGLPAGRRGPRRRGRQPQDDQAVGRRGRAARPRSTGSWSWVPARPAAVVRSPAPTSTSTGAGRRGSLRSL